MSILLSMDKILIAGLLIFMLVLIGCSTSETKNTNQEILNRTREYIAWPEYPTHEAFYKNQFIDAAPGAVYKCIEGCDNGLAEVYPTKIIAKDLVYIQFIPCKDNHTVLLLIPDDKILQPLNFRYFSQLATDNCPDNQEYNFVLP